MSDYEQLDLDTLKALQTQHQNNLQILELQLSQYSVSKPIHLINKRNAEKTTLAAIQVVINQKFGLHSSQQSNLPIQPQSVDQHTTNKPKPANLSEGEFAMQPKPELTEPKAMIKAAWIGAVAVIIAAIIGIFKFMPNERLDYQVEVLDNSTNKPISQAKVIITLPNLAPLEAFSDNNGLARIPIDADYNGKAGRLNVEKAGYDSQMSNVDIKGDSLSKQVKLIPNQANSPQATATLAPTPTESAGGITAPKLIGCWNNNDKPRNITNINIRESSNGIKIGFKANCTDSTITDELDAVISGTDQITLTKPDETWVFSIRKDGTLRLTIESQTSFEELTFYKQS